MSDLTPADLASKDALRERIEEWLHDGRWPEPYDLSHAILGSDWCAALIAATEEAQRLREERDGFLSEVGELTLTSNAHASRADAAERAVVAARVAELRAILDRHQGETETRVEWQALGVDGEWLPVAGQDRGSARAIAIWQNLKYATFAGEPRLRSRTATVTTHTTPWQEASE